MVPMTFSIEVLKPVSGVIELAFHGVLDAHAERAVMSTYDRLARQVFSTLLLNFAALDGIDAEGAGVLVRLITRAQRQKRRVMGCGLKAEHRKIFELTKLAEAMAFYPTEGEAVAELRPFVPDEGRAGLEHLL